MASCDEGKEEGMGGLLDTSLLVEALTSEDQRRDPAAGM